MSIFVCYSFSSVSPYFVSMSAMTSLSNQLRQRKLIHIFRFGLITVTHARNGVYTYFREHIDSYGGMDCPEVT